MMVDHHGYLSVGCIDLRGGFLIGICWLDAFQCLYGTCSIKGAGAGGGSEISGPDSLYCTVYGAVCGAVHGPGFTLQCGVRCSIEYGAMHSSFPDPDSLCRVACGAVQ